MTNEHIVLFVLPPKKTFSNMGELLCSVLYVFIYIFRSAEYSVYIELVC